MAIIGSCYVLKKDGQIPLAIAGFLLAIVLFTQANNMSRYTTDKSGISTYSSHTRTVQVYLTVVEIGIVIGAFALSRKPK